LALLVLAGLAAFAPAVSAAADKTYAVGKRSYTFVDTTRPTAANGTYAGAPTRTLPTLLLYPAKGDATGAAVENAPAVRRRQRFPLVVFSHGFTASGPAYQGVLERIVRAGYVVALPTFPLSNGAAPGKPTISDYVNQPGDVSFVLDRVLRIGRNARSLNQTISRTAIGAVGHSLGAITTLGVATNSCCLDRRIDAAVAWSGIQLSFAGGSFYSIRTPPLMLIHGSADRTVPFVGSSNAYDKAPAPKALVTLENGPHTPFGAPYFDPTTKSTTDWLDRYLKGERGALRQLAVDATIPGVASLKLKLR